MNIFVVFFYTESFVLFYFIIYFFFGDKLVEDPSWFSFNSQFFIYYFIQIKKICMGLGIGLGWVL